MATPPVFSAGAVLTASQMNAVGLWLITSQAVGTGVSSVTVNSVFSSDFDNYFIAWSINDASNSVGALLQLGSATSNYKRATWAFRWDGNTFNEYSAGAAAFYVGACTTGGGFGTITLMNPYLSQQTRLLAQHCYPSSSDGWSGHSSGIQTDSTSFTAFTLKPASGTYTGGYINVYGYRD